MDEENINAESKEAIKKMQVDDCHIRHDITSEIVALFTNDARAGNPRVEEGQTTKAVIEQLLKDGLIQRRPGKNTGPGFVWYDLTDAGRGYNP